MENEFDIYDELRLIPNTTGISTIAQVKPRDIVLPKIFKDVIMKTFPEIRDIVCTGYRENTVYNPMNFEPIKRFMVGVDVYFDDVKFATKPKNEYNNSFDTFFKMTYSDVDFVSFHVQSYIFPPEKTNEEVFFEIFSPNHNPVV